MAADHSVVTSGLLRGWPLPTPGVDKNSRGRVLIVGGSAQTPGAVALAAEAALRSGAGKVQVATVASVATSLAVALPETLVRGLAQTAAGAIDPSRAELLLEMAQDCSALLIGPGLMDVEAAAALTGSLVPRLACPVVLDALALAWVGDDASLEGVLGSARQMVLTPNPAELALTLHWPEADVRHDGAKAALELARDRAATVAYGGEVSYVADPDGRLWRDDSGTQGLAVAGSGDVKAGIVAGLLARGAPAAQAAVWAAFVHGRAGERLTAATGPSGFLARELPAQVPRVLAELTG